MAKGPVSPERRAQLREMLARGRATAAANRAAKKAKAEAGEMAVTILNTVDDLRRDDIVTRQKAEIAQRVMPSDTYKTAVTPVKFGNGQRSVTLRYPVDGTFVFATWADNPDWHAEDRQIWQAVAGDALDRFCATRGVQSIHPPREETINRYNLFVETRERIQ